MHVTLQYCVITGWRHTVVCVVQSSLCTGELDHLPEVAFYMVGPIEEVMAKAEKLAQDQQ